MRWITKEKPPYTQNLWWGLSASAYQLPAPIEESVKGENQVRVHHESVCTVQISPSMHAYGYVVFCAECFCRPSEPHTA